MKPMTGPTAAVRAFVLANPGATTGDIKDAIAGGDKRLRNTVAATLSAEVKHEVMRVEIGPKPAAGRPVRRYWVIDKGPMTGRRRGRVWSSGAAPITAAQAPDDPDDVEPRKPTWPPTEVQRHEVELRRPAPASSVGPTELEITVAARHVITEGGHPALQFTIPVRSYLELLRRYR